MAIYKKGGSFIGDPAAYLSSSDHPDWKYEVTAYLRGGSEPFAIMLTNSKSDGKKAVNQLWRIIQSDMSAQEKREEADEVTGEFGLPITLEEYYDIGRGDYDVNIGGMF